MPDLLQVVTRVRAPRVTGRDWSSSLMTIIVVGLVILVGHGIQSDLGWKLAAPLLLAGACLLLGIFIGFLFGIPRSLQPEGAVAVDAKAQRSDPAEGQGAGDRSTVRVEYRANTNLEQISDWLTKILVGVGLTQLTALPEFLSRAGRYFGPALGGMAGNTQGDQLAITIILFFSLSGFLLGYLWTRLFLGGELARADYNAIMDRVEQFQEKQAEQADIDANAINLANQYLSAEDPSIVDLQELKDAVIQASAPVKVQLFYMAREARKHGRDVSFKARSIPIFEALVASDPEKKYHKNYAQLAFALKDKVPPDYRAAQGVLTKAIDLRGPPRKPSHAIYELNRAICRVMQDASYRDRKLSSPEDQKAILADIDAAIETFPDLHRESDLLDWLKINAPARLERVRVQPDTAKDDD